MDFDLTFIFVKKHDAGKNNIAYYNYDYKKFRSYKPICEKLKEINR